MNQRVSITTNWWYCHQDEVPHDFDRFTVFTTHRCNLFCQYCTGPHRKESLIPLERRKEMLSSDLSIGIYSRLLEELVASGAVIRHAHFTGGEPTLNKDLYRMVDFTTNMNFLSSITTNGTADPAIYRQLIECGLTEVRISLDSYNAQQFDTSVGVRGAFERTLRGIREIVRLRDEERKRVFLVINACVTQTNLAEVEKTLRFLLDLKPDDIKFLVVVQDREYVSVHRDDSLKARLQTLVADYPPESFPLLRIKIGQMFDQNAVGLRDNETQQIMEHCFLPLMERTLDGKYYYPCSIYARYGDPIGHVTDSMTEQQQKTVAFVDNHDCRQDPICLANCVNCCRRFNIGVNNNIRKYAGLLETEIVSPVEAEKVKTIIASIDWTNQPSRRFLIVKPYGMTHRQDVLDILSELNIPVISRELISGWGEVFATLFYGLMRPDHIESILTHSRAAGQVEKGNAEVWYFANDLPFDKLGEAKRKIRDRIPGLIYIVRQVGSYQRERVFRLNAVHTPTSEEETKRQLAVISYWQQQGRQFH